MNTTEQINYSLCRKNKVMLELTDKFSIFEREIISNMNIAKRLGAKKLPYQKRLWRSPKVQ